MTDNGFEIYAKKDMHRRGDSNVYQQRMFLWRNKQNDPLIPTLSITRANTHIINYSR